MSRIPAVPYQRRVLSAADGCRARDCWVFYYVPPQRRIWLPNVTNRDAWALLGIAACQRSCGVEVEQP